MAEMGAPVEPETQAVRVGHATIRVTACAPISSAQHDAGARRLRFEIGKGIGDFTFVLVCGITEPSEVKVGDEALKALADDPAEVGYKYFADVHALVMGLPCASLPAVVDVQAVEPVESKWILPPKEDIAWDFSQGPQGWVALNALTPLEAGAQGLSMTSLGADPYVGGPPLVAEAARYKEIVVRMAVSAGTGAQLYWTTKDSPATAEDKVLNIPIVGDGVTREYVFPVAKHPNWKDTITRIRVDPSNVAGAKVRIESIRGR
jgi:hypothetical protein